MVDVILITWLLLDPKLVRMYDFAFIDSFLQLRGLLCEPELCQSLHIILVKPLQTLLNIQNCCVILHHPLNLLLNLLFCVQQRHLAVFDVDASN